MEKLAKEKEMIGIYISGHPLDDYKSEIKYFCNATLDMLKNINELEGRELTFAGIISDVQHRVGKNGKPWGIFTFEDYSDAYEFRLFNEEYLKFRHFLIPNSFLYLKTSLRKSWQGADVRVQFTAIQQLQDVLNKMAKKITIQLDIKTLDDQKIHAVQSILQEHKGSQVLNFTVFDMEEKMKLTMPSRSSKIEITKELLEELQEKDFSFTLN
jgi:DNA polymerase-3 subunit alpha